MAERDVKVAAHEWRKAASHAVLLDGFHALKHAVRFDAELRCVLTSNKTGMLALAAELAPDIAERIDQIATEVPDQVFRELVPRAHPTGVAALADRPSPQTNLDILTAQHRQSPVVLLDRPRNLGNVGAVIRLAAGFGVTGVITTGDIDPWHPNAVRGSSGLHFATPVEHLSLADLPPGPLYALDPAGEDIRSVTVPDDALLAFGSERHGISSALRSQATRLVAVPMRPQVSSFNLATTVAMALYHWFSWRAASRPPVSDAGSRSTAVI